MKLSIVATLYQSSPYIVEFHARASAVARELVGDDYEIILVNDGSPDNSLNVAISLSQKDHRIVVVDLSRNFGHHKAMMTGIGNALGDLVFLLDSDLEEEPEWLIQFASDLRRTNCDVVYGVQANRKGGFFEQLSGQWYYQAYKKLTQITLPENVVTARLMTRRFVNALIQHDEREMFLGGLFALTGFEQKSSIVKKHSTSETTYTFKRKLTLFIDSVTSFSSIPLVFIFYMGLLIFAASVAYTASIIFVWLFFDKPPSGWTSVMASIWLLGGLLISFVGVIGIYLSKIFSETKRRPYTIVRQIHGRTGK